MIKNPLYRAITLLSASVLCSLAARGIFAQDAMPEATLTPSEAHSGTLTPIGGGYPDTFAGFVHAALPYVATLDTSRFYILMMPMSFTYDTETLTTTDLIDNSFAVERRRNQLDLACEDAVAEAGLELDCQVVVPPVYTREAAEDALILDYFTDDVGAVYFVGGDQTFAMQILNGTPLEDALTEAFDRGVVMGGNSAGAALESRTMIGGYTNEDFDFEDQLREGVVDLWNSEDRRGLPFGLQNAIIEQHFFQYARLGRLINAIVQPGVAHVGIGVDGYTGVVVENDEIVRDPFGLYTVVVIDAQRFVSPDDEHYVDGLLSVRNVLMHLFTAGESVSYNLASGEGQQAGETAFLAPTLINRQFTNSVVPAGAGDLTLVGGASTELLTNFADARAIVLTVGEVDGDIYQAFGTVTAMEGELPDLGDYSYITVVAHDPTLLSAAMLAPVREAWLEGANVNLVDAAAALAGSRYVSQSPIDYDNDEDSVVEAQEQGALLADGTTQLDGAGFVPLVIEPRLIDNNRWARLIALTADSGVVGLGIPVESAVTFTAESVLVSGNNSVVVFDLGFATRLSDDGAGYSFANGFVDVYAPTEQIRIPTR